MMSQSDDPRSTLQHVASTSRLGDLFDRLLAGEISRRDFIAAGTALGAGLGLLGWLVRGAQTVGAAPNPQDSSATPGAAGSATPVGATPVAVPPAVGAEGKTRGQDGELKLLFYQEIAELSPHIASGTNNVVASQLFVEPLFRLFNDGSIQPNLLAEVPSIANGTVNPELTQITLKLLPGVTWSDGTPFTAADVVFTHDWVTNPANNAVSIDAWQSIGSITAVDDLTVQVTYPRQNFDWYEPFATQTLGAIYPKHYVEANGSDIMTSKPLGTGPFVLESFSPNDQLVASANPNYRVPDRPLFATVNLKSGGDVATAVQSVVQTGDWDYVWNVQLEPDLIAKYTQGGQGQVRARADTTIEKLYFNFSDPRTPGGPNGEMSWYGNPPPILSDPAVRQAFALAVDRKLILDQLYNPEGERNTANVIDGNPQWQSTDTSWEFNPDKANQVLDDAGWAKDGATRSKNGVRLELELTTGVNSVRQKEQQIIKQNLAKVGITLNLKQIDAGILFDSAAGNTQNIQHFSTDIMMYSSGAPFSLPINYMRNWYAGADRSSIAQQANSWSGPNVQRYQSAEYDAELDKLSGGVYTTIQEAAQSIIRLNDILWRDNVTIPLVNRAAGSASYAIHYSLIHGDPKTGEDNYGLNAFDDGFWNIENWNRSMPVNR